MIFVILKTKKPGDLNKDLLGIPEQSCSSHHTAIPLSPVFSLSLVSCRGLGREAS